MPTQIVDWCRTVIHSVGKRCDLGKISAFRDFFKCSVYVADSLLSVKNPFSVHCKNVLENPVSRRVRRSKIQGV